MTQTQASCVFCKIAAGDIPAKKIMETEDVMAFHDAQPQAPVHVLVIPKIHVSTVQMVDQCVKPYMTLLTEAANTVARELGLANKGYRLVVNCGPDGGQAVYHLHLHVLGGRSMTWPPG